MSGCVYPDECSGHYEPLLFLCATNLFLVAFIEQPLSFLHLLPKHEITHIAVLHSSPCAFLHFYMNAEPLVSGRLWRWFQHLKTGPRAAFPAAAGQPTFPGSPDVASSQMSSTDLLSAPVNQSDTQLAMIIY